MSDEARSPAYDLAVIGFGFAGLATLAHVVRAARGPLRIVVIAPDASGHGLGYGTRDLAHLLNVPAEKLGLWAHAPGDFARWLATPDATRHAARLGVAVPGPKGFAARALFACYLDGVREDTLRLARETEVHVEWPAQVAEALQPDEAGWRIRTGGGELRARQCALATGNEMRAVFGGLRHPDLHDGPWGLAPEQVAGWSGPVALIGCGHTAVDAVLTLRGLGFGGEISAFSRNGLIPRAHRAGVPAFEYSEQELERVDGLAALLAMIRSAPAVDWRARIDALRPHSHALWHRFSEDDQKEAFASWATVWSVHRARMAPEVASQIDPELRSGRLRVVAMRSVEPVAAGERLELDVVQQDGARERLRPAAVIDCTGPQLDWSRSRRPLLRGLLEQGICARHHTGIGVAADTRHRVAPGLFALGNPLIGQLWESVAIPEIRDQAAVIAAHAV
jgi:uncharacterized NAD(P)/FAD-binding protein YdhS